MFPLWLKIAYTVFVCLLVPVYWMKYGPANFLWFSDIALLLTLPALWFESSLLASTVAVGVLVLDIAWNVDFFGRLVTGNKLFGLSKYMFDRKIPLPVRALSLFHVVLPPMLLWMVYRLGYDERAFIAQIILAWLVLLLSYWLVKPSENINWVRGFDEPQTRMSAPAYLALLMIGFPVLIYLPTHLVLRNLMPPV
jgi:hypothetical protein